MGKFSGMLFTCDFDHTISDYSGNVPESNLRAIEYFIREGGYFCLNTGRSIPAARRQAQQVPCNAPCLLYNGSACYDYRTEEMLFVHTLSPESKELLPLLQDPRIAIEIQGVDAHYSSIPIPSRNALYRSAGIEPILTADPPLPWMKIILCGVGGSVLEGASRADPEALRYFRELEQKVKALCADRYYVTRSMARIIEIGNPHCTKATGARELARLLDCHTLICAGDAPNDTPMLEDADYAFCPGDAYPEILSLPGIIPTADSHEGAVAGAVGWLEKHLALSDHL